jgi:hypothetical protein
MSRENLILLVVLVLAALGVLGLHLAKQTQTGQVYYKTKADGSITTLSPADYREELSRREAEGRVDASDAPRWSPVRTAGLWLAGFLTLAILSFLYKDNPFYRTAEHMYVGIAAAYYMVRGFWAAIVPILMVELFPRATKFALLPGVSLDKILLENQTTSKFAWLIDYDAAGDDGLRAAWWQLMDPLFWVPLILGIMLLMRLAPKGQWLARWPLAFLIGMTAGIRMLGYMEADFVRQIESSILPLWAPVYVTEAGQETLSLSKTLYASTGNLILVAGMLCALLYFFFSLEHRGLVGRASRLGIYVLMITFGAGFGYTVMGRIALLSERFKFVLSDWLNLIPA